LRGFSDDRTSVPSCSSFRWPLHYGTTLILQKSLDKFMHPRLTVKRPLNTAKFQKKISSIRSGKTCCVFRRGGNFMVRYEQSRVHWTNVLSRRVCHRAGGRRDMSGIVVTHLRFWLMGTGRPCLRFGLQLILPVVSLWGTLPVYK